MSAPKSSSAPQASSKPPVTLGQNTHLDPGAYVRGIHAITLGDNILIHPRAQLITIHGPLSISDKAVISEKCIIGGSVPDTSRTDATSSVLGSNPPTPLLTQDGDDDELDPVKTTIGPNVYIHASSHIHAGATVKSSVLIESHVTILTNVTIGEHSKICAGVTVDRDVEPWTVVHGNGDMKRRRKKRAVDGEAEDGDANLVEKLRLRAMDTEREGTVALFRAAARASLVKKK